MWILIWIIQSFLNATWMVLTKKVVENKKISNNYQTFFSRTHHFLIIWFLFYIWFLDYNFIEANLQNNDFLILLAWSIAIYTTYPLRRIAYANEKVSVLQPYAMLYQVFPIIIGFIFIANERANLITFISALLASIVIIWTSINYKNFKFNKYSLMVLTSSIIKSFQIFGVLFLLTKFNPASFYFTESIILMIISISLIILKKEIKQIKLLSKKYVKLLLLVNTIVVTSILLSLTLYSTLWVVTTSLLSLLYLIFIYILWYFILNDKPAKKDILVTVFVVLCIIIWMLFKK